MAPPPPETTRAGDEASSSVPVVPWALYGGLALTTCSMLLIQQFLTRVFTILFNSGLAFLAIPEQRLGGTFDAAFHGGHRFLRQIPEQLFHVVTVVDRRLCFRSRQGDVIMHLRLMRENQVGDDVAVRTQIAVNVEKSIEPFDRRA